ncbi:nuclear transport factor 2 family protein [Saccharomonospora saliphila]|uniref:nuclear transport factor 2 family protein n=1 Tax=Saccharomonospora saliphila TaxID=369829 RepID=UPI000369009B|nr:DUF4440 domain-containing protein [Saccharomonospora saliphila]
MVGHRDEQADVLDAERALLAPEVRARPERVTELLHPDFVEFGASGRRFERESLLAMLREESREPVPLTDADMRATRLADDVVLVTYLVSASGARSRRSSVWLRAADGRWRLYFHQGTPVPD